MNRKEQHIYMKSMLNGQHKDSTHNHYKDVKKALDVIQDNHEKKLEEQKKYDPLHCVNSTVRDYCLVLNFDKKFEEVPCWFSVDTKSRFKDFRALTVEPEVQHEKFKSCSFLQTTTQAMFEETIGYYNKLIKDELIAMFNVENKEHIAFGSENNGIETFKKLYESKEEFAKDWDNEFGADQETIEYCVDLSIYYSVEEKEFFTRPSKTIGQGIYYVGSTYGMEY